MVMYTQVLARTDAPIRTITRWARNAGMTEGSMEAIKEYMEERERELFATEGASAGHPWAPLAPETEIARARKHEGDKILDASGALMRSLTDSSDQNAIREVGPGFIRFGTKLGYADVHQRGYNMKGQHVPQRRPIDFSNSRDRYAILKIFKAGITGGINRAVRPSIRTVRF